MSASTGTAGTNRTNVRSVHGAMMEVTMNKLALAGDLRPILRQ